MPVDQTAFFSSLRRFARDLTGDYDLTDVLYQLTFDVTAVLGIPGAGLALADTEGALRYATASSDDITHLERVQEERQEGPCAEAHRTQTPVTVTDITIRVDWPGYRKEAERLGYRSVAGLPLSVYGERLGALNLYDDHRREWSAEEIDAAGVLADMAAGYLLRQLLHDARRRADQLQGALDSRVLIEQAKGILSVELGTSIDEAFELLRRHARNNNATLRTVARAVVEDGFRPLARDEGGRTG